MSFSSFLHFFGKRCTVASIRHWNIYAFLYEKDRKNTKGANVKKEETDMMEHAIQFLSTPAPPAE